MNDSNDKIAAIIYFLKAAKFDKIYFGGYSSVEVWEAAANLFFNMSGDKLELLLDETMARELNNGKSNC